MEIFTGSFTQQEPIPEEGIAAAIEVMRHGRLHRYNSAGEVPQAALLEQDFAALTGARFCVAVASGGQAMQIAMRACGIGPGERVLTNAFTLAPVPGAIHGIGAVPVLVESTPDLTINLEDLVKKANGARALMLSHMRGHIADMDRIAAICRDHNLILIEDCAHTMGASWDGTPTGRFGAAGCFSTQTYKHANSGEGGLIITDDPDLAAQAVLMSGSYMLYPRHGAAPGEEVFARHIARTPNLSARMDNLRAALLRPQLASLPDRVQRWRALHSALAGALRSNAARIPKAHPKAEPVPSSFQFLLDEWAPERITNFIAACAARGVELKWFGASAPAGFTSAHQHWGYVAPQDLPDTDRALSGLIDMRLPLTFSGEDIAVIARILTEELSGH
ncbi:MAG: aminotransferase [Proteobacteria bacterium]|nr:MAG: aminotransferase [Pseudomonadota bacterium]